MNIVVTIYSGTMPNSLARTAVLPQNVTYSLNQEEELSNNFKL